jgi:tRNA threonylcarbamoyladenosine biosynthesis protein TsaB
VNVLAIDTSQKTVGIAITDGSMVLAEFFIENGRHHSEILLPAIDEAFRLAGMNPIDMDLFALTIGPGSFTGLRIAATTIKGLAWSTGRPAVGVSTLHALAIGAVRCGRSLICPMLDAQKNQVYTALYATGEKASIVRVADERVVDVDEWLQSSEGDLYFIGDGARKYAGRITARFPGSGRIAEGRPCHIHAVNVATLAIEKFQRGETLDLLRFAPCYLRPSSAEVHPPEAGRQD